MAEQPTAPKTRKLVPARPAHETLQPWMPQPVSAEDLAALRAVYHGTATEHQQRRCLDFVIKDLCGVGRLAFVPGPDGSRATDLALGKQQVGLELVNLISAKTQRAGGEQG